MRCENYCSSCFILHHCRGDYEICPYGRSSKSCADEPYEKKAVPERDECVPKNR